MTQGDRRGCRDVSRLVWLSSGLWFSLTIKPGSSSPRVSHSPGHGYAGPSGLFMHAWSASVTDCRMAMQLTSAFVGRESIMPERRVLTPRVLTLSRHQHVCEFDADVIGHAPGGADHVAYDLALHLAQCTYVRASIGRDTACLLASACAPQVPASTHQHVHERPLGAPLSRHVFSTRSRSARSVY